MKKLKAKHDPLEKMEIPIAVNYHPKYISDKDFYVSNEKYTKQRIKFINRCVKFSVPFEEIGSILGISKQRVAAIYHYGKSRLSEKKRKEVNKRDKYRCRICKKDGGKTILHTHHIKNPKDHRKKNLITLCAKCHKMAEMIKKRKWITAIDKSK